ncbi:MAG: DNA-directed RNA polymerase subunit alpha [Candidatus Bathyarchaeota archaeon]|nr:DNA-directed RNA polymerase subunit alpha [Candidatus Bathyarchaeota archaeon]
MIKLPDSIKILEKDPKKIIFEIRPLYPGYGRTVGNTLRRVLFSSIQGAAITQVKIKGVPDEFRGIPGIKEDVLNILLNLKQVKLKLFGEEPQKIELKVSGEKDVRAENIKTPPQVKIINKNQHIASLTSSKAKLEMEMYVHNGFGYQDAEELKGSERSAVGVIYIDAIFSPIEKVGFWVENIRFEKRTDYNRLKMEIETDGSIDPRKALKEACDIVIQHFEKVSEAFEAREEPIPQLEEKEITLENLKLSNRVLNSLKENGVKTLNQLLKKKEEKLSTMKGLGEKGIKEIKRKLKRKDLDLQS